MSENRQSYRELEQRVGDALQRTYGNTNAEITKEYRFTSGDRAVIADYAVFVPG